MRKRRTYNPKRRMRDAPASAAEKSRLEDLAKRISYGGNPAHKRNPSDFNLSPPSQPREGKTLCDQLGVVTHAIALKMLRLGTRKGLVSVQERGGWPQNIWALYQGKEPVEAMLENSEIGSYHGYPMPSNDPFRSQVVERWKSE